MATYDGLITLDNKSKIYERHLQILALEINKSSNKLYPSLMWTAYPEFTAEVVKIHLSFKSSHLRCSVRIGVLRNFANFTGIYLCQDLFLIKLQDSSLQLY